MVLRRPPVQNEIAMDLILTIDVGVVVAREDVDHPWQDHIWRPISVFLGAPDLSSWRELRRGPGFVHYHAATIEMQLHRKETPGYRDNLSYDQPKVYVVLRGGELADETSDWPVEVHMVTASPYDVEAYGEDGDEIIEAVPMPEQLIELVSAFIDEHHVEQPFKKRKRKRHHKEEDYHFGQEPVVELRERMVRAGQNDPTDRPAQMREGRGAAREGRGRDRETAQKHKEPDHEK